MSKKISPRVREQAANYCSAMASGITMCVDKQDPFVSLAMSAIGEITQDKETWPNDWTKAEALLRTGWEP